ncbi:MAG TPA: hypothetical protein P5277_01895 [Candidatus Paceibacterota bacterium]|nr:hypothetical protein [Candidatus Paceibacterota bacterium]
MKKYYILYEKGNRNPFDRATCMNEARDKTKKKGIECVIEKTGFQGYLMAGESIRENRENEN